MALDAHNAKRTEHCAAAYTGDIAMATEMQRLLDANQRPTLSSERSTAYADCQENFYTAPSGTRDDEVMNTNLATDFWYGKKSSYDFATGLPASGGA